MPETFFGEVTELKSRAIWYEDDEDVDETDPSLSKNDHHSFLNKIQLDYEASSCALPSKTYRQCIISLSAPHDFKNLTWIEEKYSLVGTMGNLVKLIALRTSEKSDTCDLWVVIDSSHEYTSTYLVSYFAEKLLCKISTLFRWDQNRPLIIISREFADREHLEYLHTGTNVDLPFSGKPMLAPSMTKNQLESAIFEQSTIDFKPVLLVRFPNPKIYWFDADSQWPNLPNLVVEHRIRSDKLDKTLLFS